MHTVLKSYALQVFDVNSESSQPTSTSQYLLGLMAKNKAATAAATVAGAAAGGAVAGPFGIAAGISFHKETACTLMFICVRFCSFVSCSTRMHASTVHFLVCAGCAVCHYAHQNHSSV